MTVFLFGWRDLILPGGLDRPIYIGGDALQALDAYISAATTFAVGSFICGCAPSMLALLAGRAVQGFGGGLIVATALAMLRIVFPQRLWPRAMAMNAMVWG